MSLEDTKNVAQIVGVLAAGGWAYMHFVHSRRILPRLKLGHEAVWIPIDGDWQLFRVALKIENLGEGKLLVERCTMKLQQVKPLSEETTRDLCSRGMRGIERDIHGAYGEALGTVHGFEFKWPQLQRVTLTLDGSGEEKCREIEGSDSDELHFDFVIHSQIEEVLVYTHLENAVKNAGDSFSQITPKKIGWNLTTLHTRKK